MIDSRWSAVWFEGWSGADFVVVSRLSTPKLIWLLAVAANIALLQLVGVSDQKASKRDPVYPIETPIDLDRVQVEKLVIDGQVVSRDGPPIELEYGKPHEVEAHFRVKQGRFVPHDGGPRCYYGEWMPNYGKYMLGLKPGWTYPWITLGLGSTKGDNVFCFRSLKGKVEVSTTGETTAIGKSKFVPVIPGTTGRFELSFSLTQLSYPPEELYYEYPGMHTYAEGIVVDRFRVNLSPPKLSQ